MAFNIVKATKQLGIGFYVRQGDEGPFGSLAREDLAIDRVAACIVASDILFMFRIFSTNLLHVHYPQTRLPQKESALVVEEN